MKLTKSQKLFIKAGRVLEAYRHDLELSKKSPLYKLVIETRLDVAKQMLEEILVKAHAEYRKEIQE